MGARGEVASWRLGVDTGGTFTDFILLALGGRGRGGARARVFKVLSTPENPARAILQGVSHLLGEVGPAASLEVTHGSTVATNALLTRTGARTGLLATAGFEDVLEIGRQNRSRLYDLYYRRPPPLVPRPLRLGVPERVGPGGEVECPLDEEALEGALARLRRAGVESLAISFLHSYANPDHERRAAEAAARAGFAVSRSSRILPEYREYERTATTCVNAYVSPLMGNYLAELSRRLPAARLRVMQSNGGVLSARAAGEEAVRTILSGPAGGAVGGFAAARAAGFSQAITFDMGGTSTDVSLCRGGVGFTAEAEVAGCPIRVPVLDIHTVGAGGGSLAWRDAGGALRVGPQSAGADPGPICYGRSRRGRRDLGEEVTVTDAHLYLGRLDPARFLGGALRLDLRGVEEGLARLGRSLGLGPREAAEGILRVADASMERAIRVISVERGHDPRDFVLVAFGGAGGLHAASLAGSLSIPLVLVPPDPGILSARGMLTADVVRDYSRSVLLPLEAGARARLEKALSALEARARREMGEEGFSGGRVRILRGLDLRYAGQSYELYLPAGARGLEVAALREAFHDLHRRSYGYADSGRPVEVVNARARAVGETEKPAPEPIPGGGRDGRGARAGRAAMVVGGKEVRGSLYDRARLRAGDAFEGPALIAEFSGTTFLPPGWRCRVDALGNLLLEPGRRRRAR